jgi:hypothetical protein
MMRLWHRLVRLWYRLPLAIKVAVPVAGLMVIELPGVLLCLVQYQKSAYGTMTYLDDLVLWNACLMFVFALGAQYFALKRMANWPFLPSLRHGTAGTIVDLALVIVIGLSVVALFYLFSWI